MEMLNAAVQVMVFMAVGFVCRKLKWTNAATVGPISKIVLNVALPCLVITSMMTPFEMEKLQQGFLSLAMVLILQACFTLTGMVWARMLKRNDPQCRAVLRAFFLFNNFMLIGVPIIAAVLGSEGVFYTGLMGLPQRVIMFIALPLMYGAVADGENHVDFNWKMLFQIPSVSVFVGLFFFITQIQLPQIVVGCMETLGDMTLPLGMMLAGMQLGDVDLKGLLKDFTIPVAVLIKNMVSPAIALVVLSLLRFPPLLIELGVIFAAVPAPAMMVVYAANYNVRADYAGAAMFLSTLLGSVTLPLWSQIVTAFVS